MFSTFADTTISFEVIFAQFCSFLNNFKSVLFVVSTKNDDDDEGEDGNSGILHIFFIKFE